MDLCLLREALATQSTEAETALALQGLGSYPVLQSGREEVVRRWLPAVAAGDAVAAFALTEPEAGSDAAALTLRAERGGAAPRRPGAAPGAPARAPVPRGARAAHLRGRLRGPADDHRPRAVPLSKSPCGQSQCGTGLDRGGGSRETEITTTMLAEVFGMARRDIEFDAGGVTLRGWFYPAEGAGSPGPAVVMAHGFSAVKEMYLDRFAEVFAAAGLNVLVFDNRCFGASDGEPRQEIDPWAQVRDYRDAITYLHTLPEVDPGRIGIWGSSYSGGHVLVVAAIDRRVKAVVSQVPLISGHANLRALVRADFIAGFRELFDADRLARFQGKAPGMVPVVDKDPLAASALPTPDSWEWFSQTGETRAPAWRNEVTLRSVEMFTEYEPGGYLPWISPTPLLLLVAVGDHLVPSELAIAAFDTAHQPKELIILPGGHFDAYTVGFEASSGPARDWFLRHLGG